MADEKNIQEKYMQFQQLQQHLEQITKHLEMLHQQQQEIEVSIEALKELQDAKLNTEILAPVANGIFFKAELKGRQQLLVNVGADVAVEKAIPEVIELLEEQKEKIAENITGAESAFQELQAQGLKIYQEVENGLHSE